MENSRHAVLVTGAASGLGEATALGLAGAGCTVYAGVRSEENAERLAAANPLIRPVLLDVADAGSITAAGKVLREQTDGAGLHGLVNNAGVCVSAPLECLPVEDLRAELEVNLVGMVALTQELLPLLRARTAVVPPANPAGRIVNISSGIGRVAAPFLGAYAASQFAKEGVSDALRRELAPSAADNVGANTATRACTVDTKAQQLVCTDREAPVEAGAVRPAPTDVFVNLAAHPLFNVEVGQFYIPFSLENRISDNTTPFLERSMATRGHLGGLARSTLQAVDILLRLPDCAVKSVKTMEVEPAVPPDFAWWE